MITEQRALQYKEELHPAYAGYLHDGAISNRDQLASIFALADKGSIDFIYENGSITNPIKILRKTNIKPKYDFENEILELIFNNQKEVPVEKVENIIENGSLKNILKNSLTPIKNLSLDEHNLEFGNNKNIKSSFIVNGVQIDSVELASQAKKPILMTFVVFIFLGLLFSLTAFFTPSLSDFAYMGAIFLLLGLKIGYTYFIGPKYVKFQLPENVNDYKQKYLDLYEFLKQRPLDRRKLTDEFLPYAIAFGLNEKWTNEFGIETDFQINGEFGGNS